jgi:hypothetical protein
MNLDYCFMSSANLAKIAECCTGLENLTISYFELSFVDIKEITSLPHLKRLDIGEGCKFAEGALLALARLRWLMYLEMCWRDGMSDILRVIGRKIASLVVRDMSVEMTIAEYCPYLQYL